MNTRSFLSTTALALATAITFNACSSDDSSDNNNNAGGGNSSSGGASGSIESVAIGTQVWMKKNLDVEVAGSRCYEDSQANCDKYGRLYDWDMAQTACPSGWKLPSRDDWNVLIESVGGVDVAGKHLKATSDWDEGGNGDNSSGFSALPGGLYHYDGVFAGVGILGNWWTATETGNNAYIKIMYQEGDTVGKNGADFKKSGLLSVRCIKD